jgi:hypothetical protein
MNNFAALLDFMEGTPDEEGRFARSRRLVARLNYAVYYAIRI